jgi:hypothetical protein
MKIESGQVNEELREGNRLAKAAIFLRAVEIFAHCVLNGKMTPKAPVANLLKLDFVVLATDEKIEAAVRYFIQRDKRTQGEQ